MKVVLDCDTGIDDAVAIALALASDEAEILGIGSVHGNIEADVAAENTLKLLEVAGRTDIPVAVGAAKPLFRELSMAKFVQGDDGLGNTHLPASGLPLSTEHAVDQIVRLAREHPGEITLIPTGPLTNLALALFKEPALPQLIKEVVLMGGTAVHPGNVGAVAEANVWHDPEAASVVFDAAWPVTMVGLDVTMQTLLLEEHLDSWRQASTPLTQWLLSVVAFYFEWYSASLGRRACAMHDAVAVGMALGLVRGVEAPLLNVAVSAQDGPALGQTVVDRRPLVSSAYPSDGAHTRVVLDMDSEGFVNSVVERIAAYGSSA